MKKDNSNQYCYGWAYPSSPNAERFNRGKGCWVVSKFAGNQITLIPLKAFHSEEKAKAYLNEIWPPKP